MRQLLITVLLIAAVVSMYSATVQEDGGMKDQIEQSGIRMANKISAISP
jgi:hypothetical protein